MKFLFALIQTSFLVFCSCSNGNRTTFNSVKLFKFVGAPVDGNYSSNMPSNKFIIRSDLQGKIKIIVKKGITTGSMNVKVELNGLRKADLANVKVNYKRSKEKEILLEVYQPQNQGAAFKLDKRNIIVVIATGSVCLFAILLTISVLLGIFFYRKIRKKKIKTYYLMDSYGEDDTGSYSCGNEEVEQDDSDELRCYHTEDVHDAEVEDDDEEDEDESERDETDCGGEEDGDEESGDEDGGGDEEDGDEESGDEDGGGDEEDGDEDRNEDGDDEEEDEEEDQNGSGKDDANDDRNENGDGDEEDGNEEDANGGGDGKDVDQEDKHNDKENRDDNEEDEGGGGEDRDGDEEDTNEDEEEKYGHGNKDDKKERNCNDKDGGNHNYNDSNEIGYLEEDVDDSEVNDSQEIDVRRIGDDGIFCAVVTNETIDIGVEKADERREKIMMKCARDYAGKVEDENSLHVVKEASDCLDMEEDNKEEFRPGGGRKWAECQGLSGNNNLCLEKSGANLTVSNACVTGTQTVNGSNITLITEDIRNANLVSGCRSSNHICSPLSECDFPEEDGKCPVKNVIKESINIQKSVRKNSCKDTATNEQGGPNGSRRNRNGRPMLLGSSRVLFIVCLIAVNGLFVAASLDANSLQTASADITIEIPAQDFIHVHIFLNNMHNNPVFIIGDKHEIDLKIFDVESASNISLSKCKKESDAFCLPGTCDPKTGQCVCPRGQIYDNLFGQCIPDCSRECPIGFFMAQPCSPKQAGVCKHCRSPCSSMEFENTPCGGAFDRKCSKISLLPPLEIDKNVIHENRFKVSGIHKRITVKDDSQQISPITIGRGTGLEVVIYVINASFDAVIEEVNHKQHAKADGHRNPRLCSHNVPDYYIAKRTITAESFYFNQGTQGHCGGSIRNFLRGAVYCLGTDNDLVRLFGRKKIQTSSQVHSSEKAGICSDSMKKCLHCRKQCAFKVKKDRCAYREEQCYLECEAKECLCRNRRCACYLYESFGCYDKVKKCVGVKANVITLEPIYSKQFTYCHVKLLRLASYELRADLYHKGELISSKRHLPTSADSNFGYMTVKAPDMFNMKTKKNLLLRMKETSSRVDIGYYKANAKQKHVTDADALAFLPHTPFGINEAMWGRSRCSKINTGSFTVVDKIPLTKSVPMFFHKLGHFPVRDAGRKLPSSNGGRLFYVSKSQRKKFLDFVASGKKSVLRYFFSNTVIVNDQNLLCRLLSRKSHWSIEVSGRLESCPGYLSVRLFDQENPKAVLQHYDIIVNNALCSFDFKFNLPFKNDKHRADKAFVLHLTTGKQTMKLIVVREKTITRLLNTIKFPRLEKSKLMNIIFPIIIVAAGFIILLVLLLLFGYFTRPKDQKNQADRDNELHFRHVLLIVWYIGARVAKSLLFTIVFIVYLFTVIHSTNYNTLKTFKQFQTRENTIYKNIYREMEKHRIQEIDRQNKQLVKEINICDITTQKLDEYLSEHRRKSVYHQELAKRAKSFKISVLNKAERNIDRAHTQYEQKRREYNAIIQNRFGQIRDQVNRIQPKVVNHHYARAANVLYRMYRFFGGGRNYQSYIGIHNLHTHDLNYRYRLESINREFSQLRQKVKALKKRQEKNDENHYRKWVSKSKTRVFVKPPTIEKFNYTDTKIDINFDKQQAKNVFALVWVSKLLKDKIFSTVGVIVMITLDVLFFIYRHTRTYAMAVLMIYGFERICNLDKMERKRLKTEEKRRHYRALAGSASFSYNETSSSNYYVSNDTSTYNTTLDENASGNTSVERNCSGMNTSSECYDDIMSDASSVLFDRQEIDDASASVGISHSITGASSLGKNDALLLQQRKTEIEAQSDEPEEGSSLQAQLESNPVLGASDKKSSFLDENLSRPNSSQSSLDASYAGRYAGLRRTTGNEENKMDAGNVDSNELKQANGNIEPGEANTVFMHSKGADGLPYGGADGHASDEASDLPCDGADALPCGRADCLAVEEAVDLPCGGADDLPRERADDLPCEKADDLPCEGADDLPCKGAIAMSFGGADGLPCVEADSLPCKEASDLPCEGADDLSCQGAQYLDNEGEDLDRNSVAVVAVESSVASQVDASNSDIDEEESESSSASENDEEEIWRNHDGKCYSELRHNNDCTTRRNKNESTINDTKNILMTGISGIGFVLRQFLLKMKKFSIVNVILFNTHLIPMFLLLCFLVLGIYFVIITAKFVLHTPILDEVGFFDLKMSPIITYRKVVNTRVSANAFMINHVQIPYYEARINARINMYELKAKMFKKLQCVRSVLYNTEYCSWSTNQNSCHGINTFDDGFYKNLTKFKCHIRPAIPRRYSKFDKVQFKLELIRSYDPYVRALRGIILDTFDIFLAIIGIQVVIKIFSTVIFKLVLSFDLVRQVKVYKTKRPIEAWNNAQTQ